MKKAFTMIELIFVIVILGILAAVAIPRLSATRDDAEITTSLSDLHVSIADFGSYYTAKGTFDAINQMTNVNRFDNMATNVSGGGVVHFQTKVGSSKENCVTFTFSDGGKLNVQSIGSATGVVCKEMQKTPSFKTLDGNYVLGGINVVH